jgi:hypothetical protein
MARSAEDLTRLREFKLPKEFMLDLRRRVPLRGGEYRYFQSKNVVCIEHFREPHTSGQKAGQFGWLPEGRNS